jgi:hypothetical protein
MQKITLTPWQSGVLHTVATFVVGAVVLWLSGHPDIASMTVSAIVAGIYNWLQGKGTSDQSA